ncbi:MAG: efflux RND transporter periplasmic adaptor subunit [Gammaproteobacteria bacterium]|nr:efflux RND transporter periplasmic adaptor subunit [Gammaproteobacteria bacterium]
MLAATSYRLIVLRIALLTTIAVLLSACNKETNQQGSAGFPPPLVSVAEVVVRDVMPWDEFNGRIEATQSVQIRPRVRGVIEQVRYHEGDIVKQGDLLFVLDQRPFRAELNRAEAELARAQAQAALAHVESQRAKNLIERKLVSKDEYDQRIAAEAQANANVRSVNATLQLARLNMDYTEIRSPISGRTGRAFATKGNLVSSDPRPDVLTTIVSLDPVYVYFDSDELTYLRYSRHLQQTKGPQDRTQMSTVFVGLGNEVGFPREGYVDFVNNQVDPDTGTIRLRAVLENKDYQLKPGLFARIKLLGRKPEQVVLIDDKAILTDQNRKYVYVLDTENRAMRRDVEIGRAIDGLRIATTGLKPGERIIVHGVQKIFFPAMPVSPQLINMGEAAPVPGDTGPVNNQ